MTVAVSPRQEEIESTLPADLDALPRLDGLRLRALQMTRLKTFVDAAFAITMLVPTFIFNIFVIGIFWRGIPFNVGLLLLALILPAFGLERLGVFLGPSSFPSACAGVAGG